MTIQVGDSAGNAVFTDVVQQGQALGSLNAENNIQLRGQAALTIQVLTIGTQTLIFEATTDGSNWTNVNVFPVVSGPPILSTTANGHWIIMVSGFSKFRTRCSAYTSGSATVSMIASRAGNEQTLITGVAQASVSASQLGQIVMGNVTTAAPAYTTAQSNPLSLTTGGATRSDWSSQASTAITSVPVAVGTGAPSGNAPCVNASIFGGVSPAGGATGAAVPAGAVYAGVRAQNANPTAVTNGQTVGVAADLAGRLITTPLNYRTLISHTGTTVSVSTISTIAAAAGASIFRDITQIVVTTAGVVAQTLTFTDGTNAFILDYPNAAVAPGAPLVISFIDVPLRATTANTVWQVTQSLATTCHYLVQYVDRLA